MNNYRNSFSGLEIHAKDQHEVMVAVKIGRAFYAIALVVYGIQQFVYSDFRNVQIPAWQTSVVLLPVWAYLTGFGLLIAAATIVSGRKARETSLILGGIFLFLFLFIHVPFEFFGEVNSSKHLALWTDALKELALAGGAFVIAGSFRQDNVNGQRNSFLIILEKLIPYGHVLFSIPMICFGFMHFMYAEHVSSMVPAWFPDHFFWTYFAAVALIGSGAAIILKIRQGAIALLLSAMILFWVILLHIPAAISNPFAFRGNEVSSTFDALAFSGIALVISLRNLRADVSDMFGTMNSGL